VTETVIVDSEHVITAPLQKIGGTTYDWDKWSDGGAQTHTVIATGAKTITATMSPRQMRTVDTVVHEPANGSTTTVAVPVRLNARVSRQVTVNWATEPGTAGSADFVAASGALVFPAGTQSRDVVVTVKGDATAEGTENFGLRLSAAQNADLVDDFANVTIEEGTTPIANAGKDFGAVSEATVTLDGTASTDNTGTPLTYTWTQIDGPVATIDDRHAIRPRITVPKGPQSITFRLTVTNGNGASSSDDVNVNVNAPK
jgi:hypothetical protein